MCPRIRPRRRASQRFQPPRDVSFPRAKLEVEVVLALALRPAHSVVPESDCVNAGSVSLRNRPKHQERLETVSDNSSHGIPLRGLSSGGAATVRGFVSFLVRCQRPSATIHEANTNTQKPDAKERQNKSSLGHQTHTTRRRLAKDDVITFSIGIAMPSGRFFHSRLHRMRPAFVHTLQRREKCAAKQICWDSRDQERPHYFHSMSP